LALNPLAPGLRMEHAQIAHGPCVVLFRRAPKEVHGTRQILPLLNSSRIFVVFPIGEETNQQGNLWVWACRLEKNCVIKF